MRIAVAQLASSTLPEQNLELVAGYTERAADAGADLVVFPEATMASFARRSTEVAEPLDGAFARGVRTLASRHGLTLVVGLFTPGSPPADADAAPRARARNTLLVTGPEGEVSYDKIHLFDAWGFEESRHVEAGSRPVVFRSGGVGIGLATCYDVRFPELFKHLARAGADVVLVPASWANGPGKAGQWRALCVARALDATCFVVGAAQADPATVGIDVRPGAPTGIGHSLVVSPLGEVTAEAGAAPELLVTDLDVSTVADARRRLPVLATSRFGLVPPGG